MIYIALALIWFALGTILGVYLGVRFRMQDEQEREERLRRLRREFQ